MEQSYYPFEFCELTEFGFHEVKYWAMTDQVVLLAVPIAGNLAMYYSFTMEGRLLVKGAVRISSLVNAGVCAC